jgi:hypothetical protein
VIKKENVHQAHTHRIVIAAASGNRRRAWQPPRGSRSTRYRRPLETALERRETRGCHNRSDYPHLDEGLNVNLVWSGPGRIEHEAIPGIPLDIPARMREVSTHGKLVEYDSLSLPRTRCGAAAVR